MGGSVTYPALGKSFLEFGNAGVGDTRFLQVKPFQTRQAAQVLQTGVGDFGVIQVKLFQARQSTYMLQARVTHICARQIEIS